MEILSSIDSPKDLKNLTAPELIRLCDEIRDYIVNTISGIGGHLAPSLGVVELTVALHHIFDAPKDKIIWDVGHQAYVHKILTGRKEQLKNIRKYNGISGFCRIYESEYDDFGAGHASTSISAGYGMVCARDFSGEDHKVVSVIGDGALTGGMAFEGLNNAGDSGRDFIVILNDNEMSIAKNVGALSKYLTHMITDPLFNRIKRDIWDLFGKLEPGRKLRRLISRVDEAAKGILLPGLLFEELGFRYIGPVDGHDLPAVLEVIKRVKNMKGPILLHILTVKGKGLPYAEKDAVTYHGVGMFNKESGKFAPKKPGPPAYTKVFGQTVVELARENAKVVGITAAMPGGTGLSQLAKEMPDRFFDGGIAEQHCVTFAAGLARNGYRPIAAIYSTFLQRAFDQIVHDVCIQKLPVIFSMDRGGLVGADGATHHGVFDFAYLRCLPNMVVMAPKDENEMRHMLHTAVNYTDGPIAMRYPRGSGLGVTLVETLQEIEIGSSEVIQKGKDVALLGIGKMVYILKRAAKRLAEEGISAEVINMRFVKPLDEKRLTEIAHRFQYIVTAEDHVLKGGFGSAVLEFFMDHHLTDLNVKRIGIPDAFVEHGTQDELFLELRLDADSIFEDILTFLGREQSRSPKLVSSTQIGVRQR